MVPVTLFLRRLADDELYCQRDSRPAQESGASAGDWRCGRGGAVCVGESGLRAGAGSDGAGRDQRSGERGDAHCGGRYGSASDCAGHCGFDGRVSEPVGADRRRGFILRWPRMDCSFAAWRVSHGKRNVPVVAIVLQSVWAVVIALTGQIRTDSELSGRRLIHFLRAERDVVCLFFGGATKRSHRQRRRRDFASPGHPVTTIIFILVVLARWSRTRCGSILGTA